MDETYQLKYLDITILAIYYRDNAQTLVSLDF